MQPFIQNIEVFINQLSTYRGKFGAQKFFFSPKNSSIKLSSVDNEYSPVLDILSFAHKYACNYHNMQMTRGYVMRR